MNGFQVNSESLAVNTKMMGDFADVLQDAEKLTADIEGDKTATLPKVDRSLQQVLEASKELYTRVADTGSSDVQA